MKWDRQVEAAWGKESVPDQGKGRVQVAGPGSLRDWAVSSRHPHSQSDAQLLYVFV